MVRALFDEQAKVAVFPFEASQCDLYIGPVPAKDEEFAGRAMVVREKDEMPQAGTLFRCGDHGPLLVTGITDKSRLCCGGNALVSGINISVSGAAQLGKRYVDPQSGMEVLCVKKGGDNEVPILPPEPLTAGKKYENVEGGAAMICTRAGNTSSYVASRQMWEALPKVLPSAD